MTAATAAARDALEALAAHYGVESRYLDGLEVERRTSPESLVAILRALGAPIESPDDAAEAMREAAADAPPLLDAVYVAWAEHPRVRRAGPRIELAPGRAPDRSLSWKVELESGGSIEGRGAPCPDGSGSFGFEIAQELPSGYHRLHVESAGERAAALLLCAPQRAYCAADAGGGARPARGRWAAFLPLHALRTERDWGAGDLADLEAMCSWAAARGASAVGTLPLFAVDVEHLGEVSPYSPLSRLFWSELWLAVDALPEARSPKVGRLLEERGLQAELAALRAAREVDYERLIALKRRVLEPLAEAFWSGASESRRGALEEFSKRRPEAESFAAFRAASDGLDATWPEWPERMRTGRLDRGDYLERNRRYHLYCQMALDEQLARVTAGEHAGVGLYLDLPVGSNAASYDVWRHRHLFASDLTVGAPPDRLFRSGQNWNLPPLHPQAQRRDGYRYWIAVLRTLFAHAAVARLDHVMGLHRLFCIPEGASAVDGAYLRYPAEELYAIVCLESHRARSEVVGEDLGTVPVEVRQAMHRHGLHRLWVFQYEVGELEAASAPGTGDRHGVEATGALARDVIGEPPAEAIACLDTHDMPPFAAFVQGLDLEIWQRLGLVGGEEVDREHERRRRLLAALAGEGPASSAAEGSGTVEPVGPPPGEHPAPPIRGPATTASPPPGPTTPASAAAREDLLRRALRRSLGALARSRASWLAVNLEDLWLETAPQNVPGTGAEERNWRRRARRTLEEVRADAGVDELLREVDALRREEAS